MPHSGLRATISTAAFIRASGDATDETTVQPHISLVSSSTIGTDHVDLALEASTQVIAKIHEYRAGR